MPLACGFFAISGEPHPAMELSDQLDDVALCCDITLGYNFRLSLRSCSQPFLNIAQRSAVPGVGDIAIVIIIKMPYSYFTLSADNASEMSVHWIKGATDD